MTNDLEMPQNRRERSEQMGVAVRNAKQCTEAWRFLVLDGRDCSAYVVAFVAFAKSMPEVP